MIISRSRAKTCGHLAIVGVVAMQAFNGVACYEQDLLEFLSELAIFVFIPLLPAFISLSTANPLRAVGACLLFAPWLAVAYYIDCVRPYMGGGASMVYAAVVIYGGPCALLGAFVTGPVTRVLGISVAER